MCAEATYPPLTLPQLPLPPPNWWGGGEFSLFLEREHTHCRGNPVLVGAPIGTPVAGALAVATGIVAVVVAGVAVVAGVSLLLVGGCGEGCGGEQRVHTGLPTDGRRPYMQLLFLLAAPTFHVGSASTQPRHIHS